MTEAAPSRVLSFDLLRGVAVLLMVEQHLGVWLWRGPARGETLADYPGLLAVNLLGGGAAPAFLMLAGMGAALFLTRADGTELATTRRTLALRGLLVMAMGYGLNLLTPSWFTLRSWYVLHLIGLGLVVLAILGTRRPGRLLTLGASILVATPLAQFALDTPRRLTNLRMTGAMGPSPTADILPGGHLRLALFEGQFPVLPWLAIVLWGAVIARWCTPIPDTKRLLRAGLACLTLGLGMLACYHLLRMEFALHHPRIFRLNVPFFPCTPPFVLAMAGGLAVLLAGCLRLESRGWLDKTRALRALGRCSLSVLIVHVVVFRELTRPLLLWQSCSVATAGTILVGTLLTLLLLASAWARSRFRYGAEWALRAVAPSPTAQ